MHLKLAFFFKAPVAPESDPDLTWTSVEEHFTAKKIAAQALVLGPRNATVGKMPGKHRNEEDSVPSRQRAMYILCIYSDLP